MGDTMYTATPVQGGHRFTSGGVTKEITIAPGNDPRIEAKYSLSGISRLYIRHGLSPNLEDLLISGQENLGPLLVKSPHRVELVNNNGVDTVRAFAEVSQTALFNPSASDTTTTAFVNEPTAPCRAHPQTHQVEFELVGSDSVHTVVLGFDNGSDYSPPDPYTEYITKYFPTGSSTQEISSSSDPDSDGLTNYQEFILLSNPRSQDSSNPLGVSSEIMSSNFVISFNTHPERMYIVEFVENLSPQTTWLALPSGSVAGDGTRKSISDPMQSSRKKFYRVRVSLLP